MTSVNYSMYSLMGGSNMYGSSMCSSGLSGLFSGIGNIFGSCGGSFYNCDGTYNYDKAAGFGVANVFCQMLTYGITQRQAEKQADKQVKANVGTEIAEIDNYLKTKKVESEKLEATINTSDTNIKTAKETLNKLNEEIAPLQGALTTAENDYISLLEKQKNGDNVEATQVSAAKELYDKAVSKVKEKQEEIEKQNQIIVDEKQAQNDAITKKNKLDSEIKELNKKREKLLKEQAQNTIEDHTSSVLKRASNEELGDKAQYNNDTNKATVSDGFTNDTKEKEKRDLMNRAIINYKHAKDANDANEKKKAAAQIKALYNADKDFYQKKFNMTDAFINNI